MATKKAKKEYNLKPDWTNVFQKLYDQIDEYEATPEVKAKLNELWDLLIVALKKYGSDALKEIIEKIIKELKYNTEKYSL